jgi:hypothetical protein
LLGLHLASRYLADCWQAIPVKTADKLPKVFYVSTDFTYARAKEAWRKSEVANCRFISIVEVRGPRCKRP